MDQVGLVSRSRMGPGRLWTPESNTGPFGLGAGLPIHWRFVVFNLVLVAVPHCKQSLTLSLKVVCPLPPAPVVYGLRGAWRHYLIQHGRPQRKSALHALERQTDLPAENLWNQRGQGAVLNGFIQTWDNGWVISGWISKAWRGAYLAELLFLRKLCWIKLSCVRALSFLTFQYLTFLSFWNYRKLSISCTSKWAVWPLIAWGK